MGVKVKICGITNLKDALNASRAGCDALGFVFYQQSPRYIAPEKAKAIIAKLPGDAIKVGVFVDEKEAKIKRIAKACGLDMLQFHGNESARFCAKFKNYRLIKAFRVDKKFDFKSVEKYHPFAFLFDSFDASIAGGTGKKFNWGLIRKVNKITQAVFLSGGLNAANVERAINAVHPDWVDVSSGVEIAPGRKHPQEIRKFIRIAKGK